MKLLKVWLLFFVIVFLPFSVFAAGSIVGTVVDAESGTPLPGANVMVEDTKYGAASNLNGAFKISNMPVGEYTLVVDYMGYERSQTSVQVSEGEQAQVTIELEEKILSTRQIAILADRVKERKTPVAYSNVRKEEMSVRLGSRDIPLVLNTTPSVYSTQQGGGAGDARINVRGFNQRNVAIMINGVPVNDMENGWVYWSNWDGVGDATSSIQMQRGLSAVNLATPSIGGTMNIITDPTQQQAGAMYKQEFGNDRFLKSTVFANSGLINGKYAVSAGLVRKTGDGVIDKTWTDAWAYYLGAAYNVNKKNRIELYALGAPQRHGQNLYKQNIGAYSHDYAKDMDTYDEAALDKFKEQGQTFNQNWSPIGDYFGTPLQAWNGKKTQRYSRNFINERENFYHKPQVNLNWYSELTDQLNLYTTVYYSGGQGGGTGTIGDVYRNDANGDLGKDNPFYYGPSPWTWNWDSTMAVNKAGAGTYMIDGDEVSKADGQAVGILRNSRNNQWTIGAISKAYYQVNENLTTVVGVDWRTAEIEHYREVRDLLGASYWLKTRDQFNPNEKVGLGEKIDYNFTNTVDWLGGFAQAEYSVGQLTTYGMAGYSTIKYTYTNHFTMDEAGNELTAETDMIGGYQIKGGANYILTPDLNVFGNVGYVSKVPIFDAVIDDRDATKAEDPENEKFTSFEIGGQYLALNGKLQVKANYYYTMWQDRTQNRGITRQDGTEGYVFITGMDQLHQGVEFEAAYQPVRMFRLDLAGSYGMWEYTDDVTGTYKDYEGDEESTVPYNYYVAGIMVGDAPQTQLAVAGSVFPIPGLQIQGVYRYYDRYWADWDPFTREDAGEAEPWQVPAYGVLDAHLMYDLPVNLGGVKFQIFAHVFNALDELYVQDAVDNSAYNAFDGDHDADDAEVFMGLPRTFTVGFQINY
ncbi:MAG: TonB-dependent receptor [candidate division KSB1 bacterium]|nr:TonB-dependent receptor [candidate division KSB1 bacterium]